MKKIIQIPFLFVSLLFVLPLAGQQSQSLTLSGRLAGIQKSNSIESKLFKAESVMKHQRALELTETQKDKILSAYQNAQSEFTKWQWELQAANEELNEMVSEEQIDEAKTLKKLETMLDLERNIKRTQLGLMIRIKNQLTTAQQEKLRELEGSIELFPSRSRYFEDNLLRNYQNRSRVPVDGQRDNNKNREE